MNKTTESQAKIYYNAVPLCQTMVSWCKLQKKGPSAQNSSKTVMGIFRFISSLIIVSRTMKN